MHSEKKNYKFKLIFDFINIIQNNKAEKKFYFFLSLINVLFTATWLEARDRLRIN